MVNVVGMVFRLLVHVQVLVRVVGHANQSVGSLRTGGDESGVGVVSVLQPSHHTVAVVGLVGGYTLLKSHIEAAGLATRAAATYSR